MRRGEERLATDHYRLRGTFGDWVHRQFPHSTGSGKREKNRNNPILGLDSDHQKLYVLKTSLDLSLTSPSLVVWQGSKGRVGTLRQQMNTNAGYAQATTLEV